MRPSFGPEPGPFGPHRHEFGRGRRGSRRGSQPGFETGLETGIGFGPAQARGFPPQPPQPPFPPVPPAPPGPGPWADGAMRGRGRGRGPGRRGRRGDVRTAILALLAERPMHGYEMIQEISERSGRMWRPSPGSVYPTLQLLTDEGLVAGIEGDGSRRLFELTEEGRAAAEGHSGAPPWEQIAQDTDPNDINLHQAIGLLMGAVHQVAQAATPSQKTRAVDVVNGARRELYAILGEVEPPTPEPAEPTGSPEPSGPDEV